MITFNGTDQMLDTLMFFFLEKLVFLPKEDSVFSKIPKSTVLYYSREIEDHYTPISNLSPTR